MRDNNQEIVMRDNPNDWLAQEKRREGYRGGKTSAEIEHEKEESSKGWNSGAVYNAQEHREEHSKIHKDTKFEFDDGTKKEREAFFLNFFLVFMFGFTHSFLIDIMGERAFIPFVFLFLSVNPGIFIWFGIFKKFPSVWYSRLCLLITIVLGGYSYLAEHGLLWEFSDMVSRIFD